ncbi:tail protein [Stenotrophomonas phage vB_SmaS_DLP_3]|nr:tail protein [Stenotrophomonas phage vB_SmaS_DLP_3]
MAVLVDIPFSGPDGSTTFTDNSGRVWTAQGGARIQDNALLLSNSGDTARTPGGGELNSAYSGQTSTVQVDIRTTNAYTGYQIILDYYMSGVGLRWQLCLYNKKLIVYNSSNGSYISGITDLNDGNWHTVKMERAGPTTRIYVGGVLEATYNSTTVGDGSAPYLTVGSENSASSQWIGSIRNLKIEVADPAQPLTHKPWTRNTYVGWDNVRQYPGRHKVWPVYQSPAAKTIIRPSLKIMRGVPPWWGAPGSTTTLPTFRLRGRVMQRDPDTGTDSPVMNAQVALFYKKLHTLIDIKLSNAQGYVEFKNLMPGQNAYYAIAFDPEGGTIQNAVIWDQLSSEP